MVLRRSAPAAALAARGGFTLMELLVVVAILVVLVGVATPMYLSYLERSRINTARATASMLAKTLETFQIEHGNLPPENSWDGVPLDRIPTDPWGNPFQWISQQVVLGDGTPIFKPIVFSVGPNGSFGPDGECSSAR